MQLPNLTPEIFWRFTCEKHGWMSNRVPCPDGDGKDNGPKTHLPASY